MVYSDINDIKALLPFDLDTGSLPILSDALLIQGHAYRMINGYIGGARDTDDNLKGIETELVIAQILGIHSERGVMMRLTQVHKVILDDYQDEEEFVTVNELYYGYD